MPVAVVPRSVRHNGETLSIVHVQVRNRNRNRLAIVSRKIPAVHRSQCDRLARRPLSGNRPSRLKRWLCSVKKYQTLHNGFQESREPCRSVGRLPGVCAARYPRSRSCWDDPILLLKDRYEKQGGGCRESRNSSARR